MYSFSTCWNSGRHTDGRAMLQEIHDLGFEYAELSHGIRLSLVPGILSAVEDGVIKISTLHNFCPLPVGLDRPAPNIYEFSSDRERDRQLALKHTLVTLDFAVKVRAPLVVLHFGSMDLKDYTGKLKELLERGEKGSPKFLKVVAEANAAREAKKKKFYDRSRDMLREIVGEAKFRNLKLGIEIREAVEELPVESDFEALLKEFPAPVYYWHDTGHAQIKEDLGFINHVEFLAARADRLAGFHLHDVKFPARDHFPTGGGGGVNFAALQPFVKPEHIKVFELSPKVPLESVQRGIAHLKRVWGEF
jgi:sugar phosphate isomerase/epimerase